MRVYENASDGTVLDADSIAIFSRQFSAMANKFCSTGMRIPNAIDKDDLKQEAFLNLLEMKNKFPEKSCNELGAYCRSPTAWRWADYVRKNYICPDAGTAGNMKRRGSKGADIIYGETSFEDMARSAGFECGTDWLESVMPPSKEEENKEFFCITRSQANLILAIIEKQLTHDQGIAWKKNRNCYTIQITIKKEYLMGGRTFKTKEDAIQGKKDLLNSLKFTLLDLLYDDTVASF